jgi:hypothetical protein
MMKGRSEGRNTGKNNTKEEKIMRETRRKMP